MNFMGLFWVKSNVSESESGFSFVCSDGITSMRFRVGGEKEVWGGMPPWDSPMCIRRSFELKFVPDMFDSGSVKGLLPSTDE